MGNFRKRIVNKRNRVILYNSAVALFKRNPDHPTLKNHLLDKKKRNLQNYRAFQYQKILELFIKKKKIFISFMI